MKSEFEWIAEIRQTLGQPSKNVLVGIGDDAAVLEPLNKLIATVDSQIENVHFDLSYMKPEEVGHKALAVNLSDIAAMGARPRYALVSLALPKKRIAGFLPGFYRGLSRLARRFGVDVVGGNLSQSETLMVDITVLGEAAKPVLRSTAKPGDLVIVWGALGEAAAGLALIGKQGPARTRKDFPRLLHAATQPSPMVHQGLLLGKSSVATSLIDISDGLASELGHLATQSGVRMEIDAASIPLSNALVKASGILKLDAFAWALAGGEDYALLFTANPRGWERAKGKFKGARIIGRVKKGRGIYLRRGTQLKRLSAQGFDHFG